ncbi:MAG: DUF167 domain-containing protein [Pyrinomonadaceae bacterium]
MSLKISEQNNDIIISVRVIPRASRTEIVGEHDGALKVRVCSPPVDSAANAEIIRLFAKHFGVSKSEVSIVSGETSKNKRIKIENLSISKFEELVK